MGRSQAQGARARLLRHGPSVKQSFAGIDADAGLRSDLDLLVLDVATFQAWERLLLRLDVATFQAWERLLFVGWGDAWIAEEAWRRWDGISEPPPPGFAEAL